MSKLENRDFVDQKPAVEGRLREHEADLSRQGAVVASWRCHRGRRLGPYFRLTWRDAGGRQRSLYLGADRSLAEEVQGWLQNLRSAREVQRHMDRMRRRLRRELARQRAIQRLELAKRGLTLKGAEVRGWRHIQWPKRSMDFARTKRG